MALVISDRIKESSTTTGTGTLTLGGAVTGFETFTANLSNGDTTYYCCTDNTDFEVGLGTFTSSGTTLARTTILASSNSNNAVSWSSGTRTVFCTLPAAKTVFLDASGNTSVSGSVTAGSFVIGSADINENDLESIDGITAGTVAASKAAVVDTNKDITGFRNVTLTGELDAGSLDVSGDADIDGTTNLDIVDIDGAVSIDAATTIGTNNKIQFRDTGLYINSSTDGQLDLVADTEIQIAATTIDINGNVLLSADLSVGDDLTVEGGVIDLKTNSGAVAKLKFYCESGNAHAQTLQAQPHSAGASDVLTLPTGGNSTLISRISTDTLTNKTLTSPKINEDVAVTSTATEINLLDGVTATTAELNILDGVTSTAAELNALDGITAVVGELNSLDLGSTAVGTAIASKAVILDSNKDYTGFRNITLSGELDAGSLDVSGDADIDGTLEADAITLNGTAITATATLSTGISNNNVPKFTSGVADDDFLRVAGTAIEGRSASEVLSDIGGTTATAASNEATALAIALG